MSAFLIGFYVVNVAAAIVGLALSVRAASRGERRQAVVAATLSLAIAALAAVPVLL